MTELDKPKMDDEYITQNDIVKRYLHNQLTPEETVEFEEYMLDKPELLERLELDSIFAENLPKALQTSEKNSKQGRDNVWWRTFWPRPLMYSAFSFAFGALMMFLIAPFSNDSLEYTGLIDLVEVSPLRSSSSLDLADATYSLSNNAESIILLLQPGEVSAKHEVIQIIRRSDRSEIFNALAFLNAIGDFVVTLPVSKLQPDVYDINFGQQNLPSLSLKIVM